MTRKNAVRGVYTAVVLQPEIRAALEKAATNDMRTISGLLQRIAAEWLREKGYLE